MTTSVSMKGRGCRICRQRKIRCDRTIPTCLNCNRGGRPCPGYGDAFKFQDERPRLEKKLVKSGMIQVDQSQTQVDTTAPAGVNTLADHGNDSSKERGQDPIERVSSAEEQSTAVVAISNETGATVDLLPFGVSSPMLQQSQLMEIFSQAMSGDTPKSFRIVNAHRAWLSDASSKFGTSALLDSAIQAASLAHVGRANNREDLVQQARLYYGRSLQALQHALSKDETSQMAVDTLGATALLTFYERSVSGLGDRWISHASGLEMLLRIRGPALHRFGTGRFIYLSQRHTLVVESLHKKKPCMLAQPEWTELGYQIIRDLQQDTHDIGRLAFLRLAEDFFAVIVKIPGCIVPAVRAGGWATLGTKLNDQMKVKVKEHVTHLQAELNKAFGNVSSDLERQGHAIIEKKQGTTTSNVSATYHYANVHVAVIHIEYWTNSMILSNILENLETDTEAASVHAQTVRNCLDYSIRSIDYMQQANMLGRFCAGFPLQLALGMRLAMTDEQTRFIFEKLEQLRNVNADPRRGLG